MTTFWLLGEEGSEEGETLKEEEEEEVNEEQEQEGEQVEEEEEEEEEACALVTYTVSDHDTERLMVNGDQNGLDNDKLEIRKEASSTKETSLKEETREEKSLTGKS